MHMMIELVRLVIPDGRDLPLLETMLVVTHGVYASYTLLQLLSISRLVITHLQRRVL